MSKGLEEKGFNSKIPRQIGVVELPYKIFDPDSTYPSYQLHRSVWWSYPTRSLIQSTPSLATSSTDHSTNQGNGDTLQDLRDPNNNLSTSSTDQCRGVTLQDLRSKQQLAYELQCSEVILQDLRSKQLPKKLHRSMWVELPFKA
ncbi:hypothetical protein RRG08_001628 [Elysia crispata]|uniref:Uncharacterized protein n=1 Tax=Elysia crispata TaxID=231223 RepID=A0AAE1E1B6_9GAST|nr:hypothetical protein RRG08_001628 [Elysia crispata]